MKNSMVAVLLAFTLACVLRMPVALAQENNEDKFSFGKVVSVNAQQVMVKEYDFAKDADVEVAYTVTAETEFGNVNAVTDLVANDDIVIDYVEKDGARIVTTLVKEDKGAKAPVVPEQPVAAAEPAAMPAVEEAPAAPVAEEAPAAPVEAPAEQK